MKLGSSGFTLCRKLAMSGPSALACCVVLLSLAAYACQNHGSLQKSQVNAPAASVTGSAQAPSEIVLLSGVFERVSRAASGRAQILRRGEQFELVLSNVTVASDSTVRVYLVGHDRASSTFLVDSADLKYDMAELERGKEQQVIALPSEPDPRLRSVVLYSPTFGINLGVAPLRAP